MMFVADLAKRAIYMEKYTDATEFKSFYGLNSPPFLFTPKQTGLSNEPTSFTITL